MATINAPLEFEKKPRLNEKYEQTLQTPSLDKRDFPVIVEERIVPRVRYFFGTDRKVQNANDLGYVVGLQLLHRSRT